MRREERKARDQDAAEKTIAVAGAVGGKKSTVQDALSGKRTKKAEKSKENNEAVSDGRTSLSGGAAAAVVKRREERSALPSRGSCRCRGL
jgi:hypothetical protein